MDSEVMPETVRFLSSPAFTTADSCCTTAWECLQAHVDQAAEAALGALASVTPLKDTLIAEMGHFSSSVDQSEIPVSASTSQNARQALEEFGKEYNALRGTLAGTVARATENLQHDYATLEKNAPYITLTLFGKTKTGKSTLIEALTGGDGSSIGSGAQHTTREVKAYYLNTTHHPSKGLRPCLRILDTPGIEGYSGEELARMAEDYVGHSDHILFMMSDDKESADELDRFGFIRTQGKGVTMLLNVKSTDENLSLLLESPEYIFKEIELDGHRRRIRNYLKEHHDLEVPEIIPVHARAAWMGVSPADLPDDVVDAGKLRDVSGIRNVHAFIEQFIQEKALPARIRAPRDMLHSYIVTLKEELGPFSATFKLTSQRLETLNTNLERAVQRARRRVNAQNKLVRACFDRVDAGIGEMVDIVIAEGGNGRELNVRWNALMREQGATQVVNRYVEEGALIFSDEIQEEVRTTASDFKFTEVNDLDNLLEEYKEEANSLRNSKFVRGGLRTAGGVLGSGLALWATTNFWNPTGWLAAAGLAVVAACGVAGEHGARKVTDRLERTSKRELTRTRAEIVTALKRRNVENYQAAKKTCIEWLRKTEAHCLKASGEVIKPIQEAALAISESIPRLVRLMDGVSRRMDASLVFDMACRAVPALNDDKVSIERVSRIPGYRVGLLVAPGNGLNGNYVAPFIGPEGVTIRRLRSLMGGEAVSIVDARAPLKKQTIQALGLKNVPEEKVHITYGDQNNKTVFLRVPTDQAGWAVGSGGSNVRMAGNLLNIRIIIESED